ncbi:MAG: cyclic nucleotide-binding domain-containing protein [Chloroflexi bacterium]|nr:cyclic nucleotide-binding domain-containing protein [Chloroflexota bacterium]
MSRLETAVSTSNWSSLQLLASQSFLAGFTLALLYTVSNTRFLLDYGADSLPQAYVVSAIFIPAVSLLYNRYAKKVTERRLLLTVTSVICVVYLGSWLAARTGTVRWISFALLVIFNALFVFQVVVITLQAARLFDIRQMKTSYPLVLASQTGGVIFGGLSITLLTDIIGDVVHLLLVCLLLSFLQYVMTWLTMNNFPREFSQHGDKQTDATLRDVLAQPYARHIFLYRFFSGFGTELIIIIFTIQAAQRFQTADSLATFFGNFMAAGTFLTLLFLILAAGRLLKRFGLRFGIMSNPILVGFVILGLFLVQLNGGSLISLVFVLAILARVLDFVLSVSITEPSMKTMYQALPERSRPALITVVEAVSQPLGYGVVGGSLLLFRAFNLSGDAFMFTYTALVCVVWTFYGWRTYRLYTTTLLEKLTLRTLGQVDLTIDDPATLTIVTNLAQSDNPTQVRLALNVLEQAEHSTYDSLLLRLLNHTNDKVQLEILTRLEHHPKIAENVPFATYLNESNTVEVRATALQTYLATGNADALDWAVKLLDSEEVTLRRAALVGLLHYGGIAGHVAAGQVLLTLTKSTQGEDQLLLAQALAALDNHNFYQPIEKLLLSEYADVRRFALQAAAKVRHPSLLPAVIAQLDSAATRSTAVSTLTVYDTAVLPHIESALTQNGTNFARRSSLVRISGHLSNGAAQPVLLPHLLHPNRELRMVLLTALQRTGYQASDAEIVQIESAVQAEVERTAVLLAATTTIDQTAEYAWLHAALQTDIQQSTQRVLRLFSFIYDPRALHRVGDYLNLGSSEEKAQAIETVDLILSMQHKQLLLPLIDNELSPSQCLSALDKLVSVPTATADEWLSRIISDAGAQFDDWTQACAMYGAISTDTDTWRAQVTQFLQENEGEGKRPLSLETARWAIEQSSGEQNMLTIEKVSFLKETEIFKNVPEAVLASVAHIVEVVELPARKQFISEGAFASEMFIIVEGSVRVQKSGKHIIELKAGDVVGELAIFDQEPRSADVITLTPTVLLKLEKETLREVMADRPEISNGIIQTLSQRIRVQGQLLAI